MTIIATIILFGIIVFIHELGHFLFAKKAGVRIHEFAIGMGPKIYSTQKGETKYSVRLLPLGTECKNRNYNMTKVKMENQTILVLLEKKHFFKEQA